VPDAKVILASGSPQRREILERLGIEFEVRVSGVEEIVEGDPAEVVLTNALLKAKPIADEVPGCLVIGCDTDVVLEGQVIGKPEDEEMARQYLGRLSGRSHWVYTGVGLITPDGRLRQKIVETKGRFKRLSGLDIESYLASGQWRGKAGAYAIQGLAGCFVQKLVGSYTNVVGLPLYETVALLAGEGFPVHANWPSGERS